MFGGNFADIIETHSEKNYPIKNNYKCTANKDKNFFSYNLDMCTNT
jgi:hypothetical protein